MNLPEVLGKAEFYGALAGVAFAAAVGLRLAGFLDGGEFVAALGLVLGSHSLGGGIAAFRK